MTTLLTDRVAPDGIEFTARRLIAASLSLALRDPVALAGNPIATVEQPEPILAAWSLIAESHSGVCQSDLGLGEIPPASADPAPLAQWLRLDTGGREAAFQRVFGLVVSKECPPYETEFCPSKDSFYRAQHMADIAGFYRAFGLEPGGPTPDRDDHISVSLEFVAFLLEKLAILAGPAPTAADLGHREICGAALRAFVDEHIIWWVPTFARCLERRVEQLLAHEHDEALAGHLRLLSGIAVLLRAWVGTERLSAGLKPVRRIVAPTVAGQDSDEGGCHSCPTDGAGCGSLQANSSMSPHDEDPAPQR